MNMEDRIVKCASSVVLASLAEKQVEDLLGTVIRGTRFSGKVHSVGGFVRDEFMGIESKDLDTVVEMKDGAEKLAKFLHDKFPQQTSNPHRLGAAYPIWHIAFKEDIEYRGRLYKTEGGELDIADTQKETFPDEGSRQRVTEYGTLEEDVERRDFTVNMLLRDLTTGEIKDLTGTSQSDIKRGLLRGHPGVDLERPFIDDPLRMIRLVRFKVKYGWDIPLSVLRAAKNNARRIKIVSSERIQEELIKVMELGKLHDAVRLMKTLGLLKFVLPEIDAMQGVEHDTSRGHHQEGDVYKHTMLVLKNARPGVENQLAALLHDVGKVQTQKILGDKIQFLGHEKVGGEIAEAIVRRLSFDLKTIKRVRALVENHMRPHRLDRDSANARGLRRFVRKVGEELVDSLLDLAEADQLGNLPSENMIPDLRERIVEVMQVPMKTEPILDGREVMRLLELKPGPDVGKAMNFLKEKEDEHAAIGQLLTKEEAEKLLLQEFVL